MDDESFVSQIPIYILLGSVAVLFYYKGRPNSAWKRAAAFVALMLGELMLFPWHSPKEWLKLAAIAMVNYIVGANNITLQGIGDAVSAWFHYRKPPNSGTGTSELVNSVETIAHDDESPSEATQVNNNSSVPHQNEDIAFFQVLRRMLWPDLR